MRVRLILDIVGDGATQEEIDEVVDGLQALVDEVHEEEVEGLTPSRTRVTMYAYEEGEVNPYLTVTREAGEPIEGLL